MKKLIVTLIAIPAIAVIAQPPQKSIKKSGDSTVSGFKSDTIVRTQYDSSQFSNEAYNNDTAHYKLNDQGTKKKFKKTTTTTSIESKAGKRSNASNK